METVTIENLDRIDEAAEEFVRLTAGKKHIAFYAPMGAGKTTFTVALCRVLGVKEPVCSPTFAIINEYVGSDGSRICHFDFYRIKNIAEAMDIGIQDYFDSGDLCIMEWPENIENILPEDTLKVQIKVLPDMKRILSWEA